jgi:enoyl-CoA hydratase/carnithine racemase
VAIEMLERLPVPTIAAVHGVAAGAPHAWRSAIDVIVYNVDAETPMTMPER